MEELTFLFIYIKRVSFLKCNINNDFVFKNDTKIFSFLVVIILTAYFVQS